MTGNATRISVLMAATFLFSLALPSLVHGQTASFIARHMASALRAGAGAIPFLAQPVR